jgi:hypothetical protein
MYGVRKGQKGPMFASRQRLGPLRETRRPITEGGSFARSDPDEHDGRHDEQGEGQADRSTGGRPFSALPILEALADLAAVAIERHSA